MNLPNKLTVFRVILIPFFVFFYISPYFPQSGQYIALAIFVIASLTDLLDGKIARKYDLITNFGKFMDPLADKLLVCSAMVCMVGNGTLQSWMLIVIICREFFISGFRLIAAENGIVIAASYWGKFKTVFQMIMVIMILVGLSATWYVVATEIVKYIAVILTLVSLADYVWKNRAVLKEQG